MEVSYVIENSVVMEITSISSSEASTAGGKVSLLGAGEDGDENDDNDVNGESGGGGNC